MCVGESSWEKMITLWGQIIVAWQRLSRILELGINFETWCFLVLVTRGWKFELYLPLISHIASGDKHEFNCKAICYFLLLWQIWLLIFDICYTQKVKLIEYNCKFSKIFCLWNFQFLKALTSSATTAVIQTAVFCYTSCSVNKKSS